MKVLIDGLVFQNDHQRGIQRYFREVLARIGKLHEVTIWNELPAVSELPPNCRQTGPDLRRPPRRWHVAALAKRAMLRRIRAASHPGADLFCSTYYTRPGYSGLAEVAIVHDMIHEQFVHSQPLAEMEIARKREAIMNARVCIAISHATAAELRAFYPEAASKVRVIHHGSEHLTSAAKQAGRGEKRLGGHYAIYVGGRKYYKNFQAVLEAMATSAWPARVKLAVIGKEFSEGEALLLKRMGLGERVIWAGEVSDEDIATWYRGSLALIFPSLAEGFGFPSLEAQSFGTPVLCSDIPVFREVCGDAAVYFDPRRAECLAGAVQEVLGDGRRAELKECGLANVRRFSWDRCAEQTLAAFGEAAGARHAA